MMMFHGLALTRAGHAWAALRYAAMMPDSEDDRGCSRDWAALGQRVRVFFADSIALHMRHALALKGDR